MAIAIIAIILCMILMNYLPVKGWNIILVTFLCSILVCVTNFLPVPDVMGGCLQGVGAVLGMMLPLFVFGAVLGEIYNRSNASVTLARAILFPFRNCQNEKVKILGTVWMLLVVRAVIGLAGFNNLAIMPLMIAVTTMVFSASNFPRKYVSCILLIAGEIQMLVPGVPTTEMVLIEEYIEGFTRMSYFVPRLLILIVYIVVASLILYWLLKRDREKGILFESGRMELMDIDTQEKCPNLIVTLLPILVIWILFAIVGWDAWLALIIGCVAALVCLGYYIPKREGQNKYRAILDTCNSGVFKLPLAICGCMLFGMVLTSTPGWEVIQGALSGLPVHPAILMTILAIIVTFAAGTTGAVPILASVVTGICVPAGLSVGACTVIIIVSFVCLDTVPNNLGLLMQCELTDTTVKEAYPSIFRTTVLLSLMIAVIVMAAAMVGVFG